VKKPKQSGSPLTGARQASRQMTPDFRPPSPRITRQVEELRAAFPAYTFTLLDIGPVTNPRSIEVRRRDDTGTVPDWLLISSDTARIWHELSLP
jgi:hypothetical protein